jgi:hypothetical protein
MFSRLPPLAASVVAATLWAAALCGDVVAKDAAAEQAAIADEKPFPYPLALEAPKPEPITPPTQEAMQASIARGVEFLLESQRDSGAWGGPQKTKGLNIFAPVPGAHLAFRTAVTALAVEALIDAKSHVDAERRQAIDGAIDRGQQWLLVHSGKLRRAEQEALYNVWGHAYALQAIAALYERAADDESLQAELKELADYHADMLRRYTYLNGGWGYYDFDAHTQTPGSSPNSFVTATVLIAFDRAKAMGVEYPEKLTEKAVASLLRQRQPDFSYAYGEYLRMMPRLGINRPAGSLGRSQACNLALRMYGREEVTVDVLKAWLDRLFARNGWLGIGRKRPVPHESHFQVAGYFYYYGHYYAAMCIDQLPEDERPYFQNHLAHILLPLQESDGSWWDYPLYDYHQPAGTAMAVSSLLRCLSDAPN